MLKLTIDRCSTSYLICWQSGYNHVVSRADSDQVARRACTDQVYVVINTKQTQDWYLPGWRGRDRLPVSRCMGQARGEAGDARGVPAVRMRPRKSCISPASSSAGCDNSVSSDMISTIKHERGKLTGLLTRALLPLPHLLLVLFRDHLPVHTKN